MSGVAGPGVSLRRGALARCRVAGGVEFLSFLGVLMLAFIANDVAHGRGWKSDGWVGDVLVAGLFVGSVTVRVAIVVEFVRADEGGVRWRSLFRTSALSWEQIESVDVGRMYLFPERRRSSVIEIRPTVGRARRVRASAWCEGALGAWIGDALRCRVGAYDVGDGPVLMLSGFTCEPFGGRSPDWTPEEEFGGLDEAVAAARGWLIHHPLGLVEVVEVERGVGAVVRVVKLDGEERIDSR